MVALEKCSRNEVCRGAGNETDAHVRTFHVLGVRGAFLAAAFAVVAAGCASGSTGRAAAPAPDVDGLLFGMARCRVAGECPTGVCSMGMCVGFLMVSTDLEREEIGRVLAAVGEPLRNELVEVLTTVVADFETSGVVRARAADALGYLGGELVRRVLAARGDDPVASVRFFAARSLHRLGDPVGTRALRAFQDHPAEAVRALVATALDVGGGADQGDSRK